MSSTNGESDSLLNIKNKCGVRFFVKCQVKVWGLIHWGIYVAFYTFQSVYKDLGGYMLWSFLRASDFQLWVEGSMSALSQYRCRLVC